MSATTDAILYADAHNLTPEAVTHLYNGCREWPTHWHREQPERVLAFLQGCWRCVTAWDGSRLVGVLAAISDGSLYAYLPHVLVHSDYQSQGIGAAMMERLAADTRDFEGVYLITHSPRARTFYERHDFQALPETLTAMLRLPR
ncbi:MAG: GNAT family N-acetyltransferase [Anaerolineae bacterium]